MSEQTPELSPCPFCGGKEIAWLTMSVSLLIETVGVKCMGCGLNMVREANSHAEAVAQVTKDWNARTHTVTQAQLDAANNEIDRLAEAMLGIQGILENEFAYCDKDDWQRMIDYAKDAFKKHESKN